MSCPAFTTDPRSTLIESTNPVTLGKTATTSYACSSPGKRTAKASFLDRTFVTSTVGAAAAGPSAPAAIAEETECGPHQTHALMLPATANAHMTIRLI